MRLDAASKDMIFSSNNKLVEDPNSCADVSHRYGISGKDGIPHLTIGQQGLNVDINSGLLFVRHTTATTNLLLKTWAILGEEHPPQGSAVSALQLSRGKRN